jgi:hypothetical protein
MSHSTPTTCPDRNTWLQLYSDRESDAVAHRAELQGHLDECQACRAIVNDVRRFQSLLQRGKAPVLSPEQRQNLEERVRLQSGDWSKPAPATPWLVWGGALAAAAVLSWLLVRPLMDNRGQPNFDEAIKAATLPTADNPGPGLAVGAVEGELQIAGRDGHWQPLKVGAAMRTGERLRSAAGGRITVPGRFELKLGKESELDLTTLHDRTAFVRLRRGEAECEVQKLRPGERFAVMFGGFRASVIGTHFAVSHQPDAGGVQVRVTEGAVRVDAADDPGAPLGETTTVVRAGQRWSHAAGVMALEPLAAPQQATRLVAEPTPMAPEELAPPRGHEATAEAMGPHAAKPAQKPAADGNGKKQVLIVVPHQSMPLPEPMGNGDASGKAKPAKKDAE